MMKLSAQELMQATKTAQHVLDNFDSSLSTDQNLVMATLEITEMYSKAFQARDSLAQMAALVGQEQDYALNGLYVGLMLSVHSPSLAGTLLESLSTSRKKPIAEATTAVMDKLWELTHA